MPRYAIWIVTVPNYSHSQAFDELALGLSTAFARLGIAAPVVRDVSQLGERTIVLGSNLLPYVMVPYFARLILFNLEQIVPGSPWLTQAYVDLLRRYPVWDYSARNIEALAALGIHAVFCGVGYVPELTRIAAADQDIDVLFVGSMNTRRRTVLKELSRRGIGVDAKVGLYGSARDGLIARSKLVINVHYYEARVFEIVRVAYLLANRKCVVSEIGADLAYERQFMPGVAFAPYDLLPDCCSDLLSDPAKRRDHERMGFERFSALSQVDYLRDALEATARLEGQGQ